MMVIYTHAMYVRGLNCVTLQGPGLYSYDNQVSGYEIYFYQAYSKKQLLN